MNYANYTDVTQAQEEMTNRRFRYCPCYNPFTIGSYYLPLSHRSKTAPTTAITNPKPALNFDAPLIGLLVAEDVLAAPLELVAAALVASVAEAWVEEAVTEPLPLSDT